LEAEKAEKTRGFRKNRRIRSVFEPVTSVAM
jgi:hypothetical protein